MRSRRHFAVPAAALMLLIGGVSSVRAGTTDLCGGAAGWQASWDSSLDPYVQVIATDCAQLGGGVVFIEKSAQFTQGPVNGVFPAIPIVFVQTHPTNVTRLVIDDEIIFNSTGFSWTDFHMDLLDGGDAVFDPIGTLASGGPPPIGFSIAPFTAASFSNGNSRLDISGGVVPNNSQWFPGDGSTDGQLHVLVTPHPSEPFEVFTLKETPTPEPSTLCLLAAGLAALSRRRRSH